MREVARGEGFRCPADRSHPRPRGQEACSSEGYASYIGRIIQHAADRRCMPKCRPLPCLGSSSAARAGILRAGDSPPIPRARPGDGRHHQLGNFQTALWGELLRHQQFHHLETRHCPDFGSRSDTRRARDRVIACLTLARQAHTERTLSRGHALPPDPAAIAIFALAGRASLGFGRRRTVGTRRSKSEGQHNAKQIAYAPQPACGARTRSRKSCQAPAMPSGRCRMHSGRSLGAPKGNNNALTYGRCTAEAIARRREISGLLRALKAFARSTDR